MIQFNILGNIVDTLNNSKYWFALMMLTMNICGKYVEIDIGKRNKNWIATSRIFRRLLIFTIAFIATRDIVASLMITAAFVIMVLHLFNEESDYCILPQSFIELDLNRDNVNSPDEIKSAYEKLKEEGKIK
jgi:hypothetical protein